MSKKKDGSYTGNPIIRARLKEELKARLEEACKEQGLTVSEYTRRSLEKSLKTSEEARI